MLDSFWENVQKEAAKIGRYLKVTAIIQAGILASVLVSLYKYYRS